MLNTKQKYALRIAQKLLAAAGMPVWFDLRLIRDSNKDLFGARLGERGDLNKLLLLADEKRVALRPEYRIELRMYSTVIKTCGVFMGQEVGEPQSAQSSSIVTGSATTWKPSRFLKPQARAVGTVLETPPKEDLQ